MLTRIIKVFIIIGLVFMVAYLGTCVYANFFQAEPGELPKMPAISKAPYGVLITSNGNLLLTDDYDAEGTAYILHGYWEIVKQRWVYRSADLVLEQNNFGDIIIERRRE